MMPDIPKLPTAQLAATLRKTIKASDAVKHGIATHAEKHAAARHAKHATLEANQKLAESVK